MLRCKRESLIPDTAADKVLNAAANKTIDANKRQETTANKKLNAEADKTVNADKRRDAAAGK